MGSSIGSGGGQGARLPMWTGNKGGVFQDQSWWLVVRPRQKVPIRYVGEEEGDMSEITQNGT